LLDDKWLRVRENPAKSRDFEHLLDDPGNLFLHSALVEIPPPTPSGRENKNIAILWG